MEQTNLVFCPYCGAEMKVDIVETKSDGSLSCFGFMRCSEDDCYSASPMVFGQNKEETERKLYAAAQRRYVPPIKPMSFDEVVEFPDVVWFEDYDKKDVIAAIPGWVRCNIKNEAIIDFAVFDDEIAAADTDYGKRWRCWSRRPTDEERMAAAWEVE